MNTFRGLRVVVAPDSFKHCLSARMAAEAIRAGILDARPDAEVIVMPVADGGEGTIDVLTGAGAQEHETLASGPLGAPLVAGWASFGRLAVIELARVAGLTLIERPDPRTAWLATTRGAGQLLRAALDAGYRDIVIAAGGTASTDGGSGALLELGLAPRDAAGRRIQTAAGIGDAVLIDRSGLDARLASARIRIASDVRAPLLGPEGAARAYGPQKGADPVTVEYLEARLAGWARAIADSTGQDVCSFPGAGAAGGFAAGFRVLGGTRIVSGLEWMAEAIALPSSIAGADLVIVAEGKLDRQSVQGKAPVAIASIAARYGVPVAALCGRLELSGAELKRVGIAIARSLSGPGEDAAPAMAEAPQRLRAAASLLVSELPGQTS